MNLARFLPATLELTFYALLFALPVGVYLGIMSAMKRNSWVDHLARILAIIGVAVPIYWLGIMLKIFFHENLAVVGLDLLPLDGRLDPTLSPPPTITGWYTIDSALALNFTDFVSAVAHLILPAFTLGFAQLALILRMTRSGMLEVLGQDYIRTARAKGVPEHDVVFKHAFRNALLPFVTLVALSLGYIVGGAITVEYVFSYPGIGLAIVEAIDQRDYTFLQGAFLVLTLSVIFFNFVADLLYFKLDPRVTT